MPDLAAFPARTWQLLASHPHTRSSDAASICKSIYSGDSGSSFHRRQPLKAATLSPDWEIATRFRTVATRRFPASVSLKHEALAPLSYPATYCCSSSKRPICPRWRDAQQQAKRTRTRPRDDCTGQSTSAFSRMSTLRSVGAWHIVSKRDWLLIRQGAPAGDVPAS